MPYRYNTIIFDFDYTLVDSSHGVEECVNYSLKKLGEPPQPYDVISKTIGLSLPETYRKLTNHDADTEIEQFSKFFVERADQVMAKRTIIFDGIADLLEMLVSNGLTLAICSTKFRYRIKEILQRQGLLLFFKAIVGAEDVDHHKPNPVGILKTIERLQCSPDKCLYVGDSLVDAEAAKRAHIHFVAVLSGTTRAEEFASHHNYAVIDTANDLPSILCD